MARSVLRRSEAGGRLARLDLDRQLVADAQQDPARFEALYRKYLSQVYSYAYYELGDHHAAEDATERTFLQALTALPRFEERGGELRPVGDGAAGPDHRAASTRAAADADALPDATARAEAAAGPDADAPSTFRVWLFQIARNVVANDRRTARRRPSTTLDDAGELAVDEDLAEAAAAREAGSAAWQAVARLPEDRRRAVVLRFVDELSTAEIAAILGRSEGAVRVLLHRALRSVGKELKERLS